MCNNLVAVDAYTSSSSDRFLRRGPWLADTSTRLPTINVPKAVAPTLPVNSMNSPNALVSPRRDLLVIVDEHDTEIGVADKMEAHRAGSLHRAFSVFVFDSGSRLLLQRRAEAKYHSGGLWSNTCCGHPAPGEHPQVAARRRLWEEMGLDCPVIPTGAFVYTAAVGNGLVEHEYDHVFVGCSDNEPNPDPHEVDTWRWATLEALHEEIRIRPYLYTRWLPIAIEHVAPANRCAETSPALRFGKAT
jgi:isopentenyl-diphosphate delta-isomerase